MKLRRLEEKDAPFMLEWMRDSNVTEFLGKDFSNKTIEDAILFINNSFFEYEKHFAIVDDNDEYYGTISLKNIDMKNKNAEYAISIRSNAMGKGISMEATRLLERYAFNDLGLERIYLCVAEDNVRAIKFYKKCGFLCEGRFTQHIKRKDKYVDLEWFYMLRKEMK